MSWPSPSSNRLSPDTARLRKVSMKTILFALCCSLVACLGQVDDWHGFKDMFGKHYSDEMEEVVRRRIFEGNQKWIAEHNKLYQQGQASYELKMNQFGDLTEGEFRELMLTANVSLSTNEGSIFLEPWISGDLPDKVDWREAKAVSRVKDQGMCGSCWAFSTIGSLESIKFRQSGEMVTLSEQQLVDCSWKYQNHGCRGGLPERAFQYIKENGGVDTEQAYPYSAVDKRCTFDRSKVGAKVSGFVKTKKNDEKELQSAVANVGPVSVCIDATDNFRFYSKGVLNDRRCSSSSINHAVLVVGYGTENGQDYWLVKNSWGKSWGDGGYIKMSRNKKNQCAIASFAVYPLV